MKDVDLHMHSTASDGALSPRKLAQAAWEKGLHYVALTDHDTLAGQEEFLSEARRLGLHCTSGVEFNVEYDGEMHILAYGVNLDHPALLALTHLMEHNRETRARAMTAQLVKKGYAIDIARVEEIAGDGSIGRPHIARALVEKGYAPDVEQAFLDFLNPGKPGFLPRIKIPVSSAMETIQEAGGLAVLAHPKLTFHADFPALFRQLKDLGLAGVEAFYPAHTDQEVAYFLNLAHSLGLFVTQGSDFHGEVRKHSQLGGETRGEDALLPALHRLFPKTE